MLSIGSYHCYQSVPETRLGLSLACPPSTHSQKVCCGGAKKSEFGGGIVLWEERVVLIFGGIQGVSRNK